VNNARTSGRAPSAESRFQDNKDEISPRVLKFGVEAGHIDVLVILRLRKLYLTEKETI
jgi:hypothetical protein